VPWVRVAAAGLLAGFASGLFGVGGGIVIVPALALLAGFPHKLATGTSLTAIVPIALAGVIGYATAGEVDVALAAPIAAGAIAGAFVGTYWLRAISGPALQLTFAACMIVTALRLVLGEESGGAGRVDLTVPTVIGLIALGLAAGILAGLLGVGGGIVIVPVLTIVFGVSLVLAKGTSLAVIVPTAIVGTLRNRSAGLAAIGPGMAVGVAGIVSAVLASQISLDLDPEVSSALFAALLVVVSVRLVVTARAAPPAETEPLE
jgi:uncharacterized membrane protein YfcA